MKKLLGFILIMALCLATIAYAQKKTLVGTVSGFECGDNCYLTIVDKTGKEHQALCSDTLCEKMMESQDDPNLAGYKGKRVKVTISQGQQFDGAGNVMGTMDAFKKIQVME